MGTLIGILIIIGFTKMCEKPTPLGVGWIAQKYRTMCM